MVKWKLALIAIKSLSGIIVTIVVKNYKKEDLQLK